MRKPGGAERDAMGAAQPAVEFAQPETGALAARAAGENFPVAMRILPAGYRRHLMAVYRFARLVDDVGDEEAAGVRASGVPAAGGRSAGGTGRDGRLHADAAIRLRTLDLVERDLDRAFSPGATPRLPVLGELGRTAAQCGIPAEPFRMLIQANRQDQTVSRYATFGELLGYCRLSANPVGRVVLRVFGAATPERERLSDLVCTALQLAEHWQDVAEDFARDRVYLPQDDMASFGCTEADLAAAADAARRTAPGLRELLSFETRRARDLLDQGAVLTGTLRGWARLAVAGYVAGGRATLAAISAADFDVFSKTPRPGRAGTVAGLFRAHLTGR